MKRKLLIVTVLTMVVLGALVGCGSNEQRTEKEIARENHSIEQLTPGQKYQVLDVREIFEYSTASDRQSISLVLSDEKGERYYLRNDIWGDQRFLEWATLVPFDHITVEIDVDGEYRLVLQ
jgi:hypothetical protein